jgi:hypothetical protein
VDGEKTKYLEMFRELAGRLRGKSGYDCAVSFSGGKDSTYTLYVLKEVFKLKVLALTFDNGFLSEQAFDNIRAVTERLGADGIIFKADFGILKKIFSAAAASPLYSPKTLERASTICTSCIGLAKFSLLKIAMEKKIPMMAWGWTPGQAPIRSAIMKINPMMFRSTQAALREAMEKAAGADLGNYFLSEEQFAGPAESFPYNVSPLAFMDYNENMILETIRTLGWRAPGGLDNNTTNCLLNSFANDVHIGRYGFHPYAFEIAGLVRQGAMTREEGLEKLRGSGSDEAGSAVRAKLGL